MQQTTSNLISVIIPTYNRVNNLKVAIESVLNQTYNNIEIIIVDDNSTDNTIKTLNSLDIPNLRIINNKVNRGAPSCRNTGIKYSRGAYIAFLDDDDIWYTEKIEKQLNHLIQNPQIDCVFCEYKYVLQGQSFYPDIINYKNTLSKTILFLYYYKFGLILILLLLSDYLLYYKLEL